MKFSLKTTYRKLLADTVTPVSIYLKLRDRFQNSILLESSDYHGADNSFSYLCSQPIASIILKSGVLNTQYPNGSQETTTVGNAPDLASKLSQFAQSFEMEQNDFPFITNGLFGYMSYEAVQYFDGLPFQFKPPEPNQIPEMAYTVYQNVIVINHFKNELYIFEHTLASNPKESSIDELSALINNKNFPHYQFNVSSEESSNYSDEEFLEILAKGKKHCHLGDVFQIVLSRQFNNSFKGDEFNVYRALRSINPSPYLFYFDYGSYKIFGSSPEAQIVINQSQATIHPIAGTFRRTGNDQQDARLAQELYDDPKENAEHIMLVDLARNDLSRNCEQVTVETFKEVQYFSHVIHLVSKVTGQLDPNQSPMQVVADTFPAGTLSGAPKVRALELINEYENCTRGYYGGAIGFMGFNGDFNHAIMIRSFLSQQNTLTYQAGAGVVAKSDIKSELQEVNNKLAALRKALQLAEKINF